MVSMPHASSTVQAKSASQRWVYSDNCSIYGTIIYGVYSGSSNI